MRRSALVLLILLAAAVAMVTSIAQPVRRDVLKDLQIVDQGACQQITATLNFPFTVEGFAPVDRSALLLIKVVPLQIPEFTEPALSAREALVPAGSEPTPLEEVVWDGSTDGPQLTFRFARMVSYEVENGSDLRSVVITLHAESTESLPCTDEARDPVSR